MIVPIGIIILDIVCKNKKYIAKNQRNWDTSLNNKGATALYLAAMSVLDENESQEGLVEKKALKVISGTVIEELLTRCHIIEQS